MFQPLCKAVVAAIAAAFVAVAVLAIVLTLFMLATTVAMQHDRQRVGEFVHSFLQRVRRGGGRRACGA